MSIYTILNQAVDLLTVKEKAEFVDKAHLDIDKFEYAHFKFSDLFQTFEARIQEFENLEESEAKEASKKLKEFLAKFDSEFATDKYFKDHEAHCNLGPDMRAAFAGADFARIETLVAETGIRRLPCQEGSNFQSNVDLVKRHPYNQWPLALHMIYEGKEEKDVVKVLEFLIQRGFGLRQFLRQTDVKDREPQGLPKEPYIQGISMLLAI